MFIDEHSVWPREEPVEPRKPGPSADGPARLFLIVALLATFLPFSLGSCVALVRYAAALVSR